MVESAGSRRSHGPSSRRPGEALPFVEAAVNYLEDAPSQKPAFYINQRPPANARAGPKLAPRDMPIHDARAIEGELSLDREGVCLVEHRTGFDAYFDDAAVCSRYYREVEHLVAQHTGAARVVAFDHNVRSAALAKSGLAGAQMPVRFAHNDYTDISGPQRVRDLLPDEADDLLSRRVAVINVWRPTRARVEATPLAVCDAQTIEDGDLVEMDLVYPDRTGEVQALRHRGTHRWLFFPQMEPHEVMLLKCFDSARDGRARFTAHSAFDDPGTESDAPARESIEVRTLAFFAAPDREARRQEMEDYSAA